MYSRPHYGIPIRPPAYVYVCLFDVSRLRSSLWYVCAVDVACVVSVDVVAPAALATTRTTSPEPSTYQSLSSGSAERSSSARPPTTSQEPLGAVQPLPCHRPPLSSPSVPSVPSALSPSGMCRPMWMWCRCTPNLLPCPTRVCHGLTTTVQMRIVAGNHGNPVFDHLEDRQFRCGYLCSGTECTSTSVTDSWPENLTNCPCFFSSGTSAEPSPIASDSTRRRRQRKRCRMDRKSSGGGFFQVGNRLSIKQMPAGAS